MIQKLSLIILLQLPVASGLFAGPNQGPVIKTFFAPYGAGSYTVPYEKSSTGSSGGLTSDSSGVSSGRLNSLKGYAVSCGYFYDWFQCDVSYTAINTVSRYVIKESVPGYEYYSNVALQNFDLRGGRRFNDPGDTSYSWLYLGVRKMSMDIPYKSTEVDALGFFAGLYGFFSAGFFSPFEIVLMYDVYAGTCRRDQNRLSTDVNIVVDRRYAVDLGLSAGIGVQYEPWDFAVILKVSSFITDKKYHGNYNGKSADTRAALEGALIGIEAVLTIPDYKNNIID